MRASRFLTPTWKTIRRIRAGSADFLRAKPREP